MVKILVVGVWNGGWIYKIISPGKQFIAFSRYLDPMMCYGLSSRDDERLVKKKEVEGWNA